MYSIDSFIYLFIYLSIDVFIDAYIYTHLCIYIYIHMCIYIYICTCVYIYIYYTYGHSNFFLYEAYLYVYRILPVSRPERPFQTDS